MRSSPNQWLLGTAVAIVVLVATSIAVTAVRHGGRTANLSVSQPGGVVQRFILAMDSGDYAEARSYLGDSLRAGCTVDAIQSSVQWFRDRSGERRLALLDTETLEGGQRAVNVRVTEFRVGPPFGVSEQSYPERYVLSSAGDSWQFAETPWPLAYCGLYGGGKPLPSAFPGGEGAQS